MRRRRLLERFAEDNDGHGGRDTDAVSRGALMRSLNTSTAAASPGTRRIGTAVAAVAAIAGLGACGESAGPEEGAVTTEDLQQIQDDLGALEDRIGALETLPPAAEGVADDDELAADDMTDELYSDADALIGQDVTVSATVTELVISSATGIAFLIGGESGEPVPVLAATAVPELGVGTVVEVAGTVVTIQRETFEEDFGFPEDELLDDPEAFFAAHEGKAALAADSVEVLGNEGDG